MKVIHTSDWHLGQKFLNKDREEEHRLALGWLLAQLHSHQADVLLVSGDIFDINNPPNYARSMYYDFLQKVLQSTSCRQIVITAGNHDSPAMLEAPAELLKAFNIFIVGSVTDRIEDELIEIKDENGNTALVVAAVPFLRERDLQYSIPGESGTQRAKRLKNAIKAHYSTLAKAIKNSYKGLPTIAMGHLYAKGAFASDKQDNIYIGNIENIDAADFDAAFDYVALGHIHRSQELGGKKEVRYSGSIIPLSFSETKDEKSIVVIDFNGKEINDIQTIAVPVFRRLKSIQGEMQEVKEKIRKFVAKEREALTPWLEIQLHPPVTPLADDELRKFVSDMDVEILRIRIIRNEQVSDTDQYVPLDLNSLTDEEVFLKKCESFGADEATTEGLLSTYRELKDWISEREN